MGRIPESQEQAIDIARSMINPDTLERYPETIVSDHVCCPPEVPRRRGGRRRGRWCRGDNRREEIDAVDLNPTQWVELCKEHGIDYPINQTTLMPQHVQVKVLALTESDVKQGAGLFSDYRRDPTESLRYLRRARQIPRRPWSYEDLVAFCSTRPLSTYHKGEKLSEDQLLDRIENQLEMEEEHGRSGYIVCPDHSQEPSKQRLHILKRVGIINHKNCPRLVPVGFPNDKDPKWKFIKSSDIIDMAFPYISSDYLNSFSNNHKHMFIKGSECFWQGRAYDFRWIDSGDFRFFRFRTKRTMRKGQMSIRISFDKDDEGSWRVRSATCRGCQAGQLSGYCHHIVVGLEGLFAISRGWILSDEVNGGKMHWGLRQSNDVKSKVPTTKLCVLAGLECLTTFTGCSKTHYDPVMKTFNQRLEESQPASVPLLMVQQLYGTHDDLARPSTSTKVRLQPDYQAFRIMSKRKRDRFQELVRDNLPKKPDTYDEAVTFCNSVSVNVGRITTYRGLMTRLHKLGFKW